MAVTYKVLGQLHPASATPSTLYTTPNGTQAVCSTMTVCNLGAVPINYRIAIRPSGASLDHLHYIVYDSYVNIGDSVFLTLGITLGSTDVVTVYSGSGDVTFNLYGSEMT